LEEVGVIPPARLYEPELDPGDAIFWNAYEDLATCRTPVFSGLGQIPWTAIHQYALEEGFDDLDELKLIVWRLDDWLRDMIDAKSKQPSTANTETEGR